MQNLTPTKIVLILLSVALIALTFLKIVEAKDFMTVMLLVTGFYYGTPSSPSEIAGSGK